MVAGVDVVVNGQVGGAVGYEADEVGLTGGDGVNGYPLSSLGNGKSDGLGHDRLGLRGDGGGDGGVTDSLRLDRSGLAVGGRRYGGDAAVGGGPSNGVVVGVVRSGVDLGDLGLAHGQSQRGQSGAVGVGEGEALESDRLSIAEHGPIAVNSLMAVGIGGECINGAHYDGPRCAGAGGVSGIPGAERRSHVIERGGNGLALLHLVPESFLILVVAGEGYGLGIAVNNARAGSQQSGTGGAVAGLLHAFADSHPNHAVGKLTGDVVLDVTTIDVSSGAGGYGPTVVIVGGGYTGVGGQAEVGAAAGLSAVGVVDNYALVGVVGRDGGTGSGSTGEHRAGAAHGLSEGGSLLLVLIGEAGILAVVRTYEQNVDSLGAIGPGAEGNDVNFACVALLGVTCSIVIEAVHAVYGESELDVALPYHTALVDVAAVESCLISSRGYLGGSCLLVEGFSLNGLDLGPRVIEKLQLVSFSDVGVDGLGHRCYGEQCGDHNDCQDRAQELFKVHVVILLF